MQPGGFTVGGAPVQGRGHVEGGKKGNRNDHVLWLHEYLNAVGGPQRGEAEMLLALDELVSAFGQAVIDTLSDIDKKDLPLGSASDGNPLYYTGRRARS
eukprot:6262941-Prymnesium_polylepis.1